MISGNTVPWVALEHPGGFTLALKWIDSKKKDVARAGWNTLVALAATVPGERLPVKELAALLDRVARTLAAAHDGGATR